MALSGCSSLCSPVVVEPSALFSVVDQWPQSQIHDPQMVARSPSVGQAKNGSVPLSHSKCRRRYSSSELLPGTVAKLLVLLEVLPATR
jgi:hypothetical protein